MTDPSTQQRLRALAASGMTLEITPEFARSVARDLDHAVWLRELAREELKSARLCFLGSVISAVVMMLCLVVAVGWAA